MRLFIGLFLIWLAASPALAERRVALVIGNSDYRFAPALRNPVNDATAIAAALQRLGFEVLLGTDLETDPMRRRLRDFSLAAEGADLALFFYAGHGLQVSGRNYLVPIDAAIEREGDLDFAAIDLQLVLNQLDLTAASSVVLLDACRDNPFETRLSRSMGSARSTAALGRGLAPVETLGGALIGFATDPGEVAYDGDGAHSPFTEALLAHIETPGLEINAMMTRVRAEVVTRTGRLQRPWSTSSLLNELYLAPQAPEPAEDPVLADVELWKAADQEGTPQALEAYLQRFPDGLFADLARDRLAELAALAAKAPVAGATAPEPLLPTPDPTDTASAPGPEAAAPRPTTPDTIAAPEAADTARGEAAAPADCPLCPALVALPGGRFAMGSSSAEATEAEGPVTTVTLAPFRIAAGEITIADYRRFTQATGYRPDPGCYVWTEAGKMRLNKAAGWQDPGLAVTDDHPAACLNWQDAKAYADWLGAETGLAVRLPSEAELEYAIRAGSTGDYPFDGGAEAACASANGADAASRFSWRNKACEDGFPDLAPVSALPANALGLKGATGNLWEWAADCWNPSHKGATADGAAREKGACESRVLRGGSWDDPVKNLRAPYRVGIPASRRQANVGFRIVVGGETAP